MHLGLYTLPLPLENQTIEADRTACTRIWLTVLTECNPSVQGFFFFSKRILLVAFSSLPYCYSVAMWNKFQGQAITLLTFLITPLLWAKNQSESGMSMEASSNNACLSWGSGWALLSYVISHLCCFTPTFDFFLKRVLSLKPNNHEIVQTINSRLMHISPHTCWIAASCLRNPYSL